MTRQTPDGSVGSESRLRRLAAALLAVVSLTLIGLPGMALASEGTPLAPSIASDQADYAPGAVVTLTGSDWNPGESVEFRVNDDQGETWWYSATTAADENGAFVEQFTLPDWFVATYRVAATGDSGRTASTTFTDGNVSARAIAGSQVVAPIGWAQFTANSTCTGTPFASGTTNTATSSYTVMTSAGSSQSARLTAPATITVGAATYTFQDWSGTATNPLCIAGSSASFNRSANYAAAVTNTAPTITAIADQSTTEDTAAGPIGFTVGDAQTPVADLTLSGSSSNTSLVANAGIGFGGSGASRTVTLTPAANASGTSTITITVTDGGGLTATEPFVLTVNAVNDAPTISDIADQSTNEDTAAGPIEFTIADVETPLASLGVSGSSSDTSVVTAGGTTFGGAGGGRTLTLSPVANASGTSTITVTVSDSGGLTASDQFVLTVNAGNDAPTAGDDTEEGNEDAPVVINPASLLANDTDIDNTPSSLTIDSMSGATGGSVGFNDDGDLVFTPSADECGEEGFGFDYLVSDGELTDTGHVTISLGCVNDAPEAAEDAEEGTEDTALVIDPASLLENDSDIDTAHANLTLESPAGAAGGSVGFNDDGDLVFTPSADECGEDGFGFEYTVSDGELTDTGQVTITVACVNDAPVAENDGPLDGTEDTPIVIDPTSLLANDSDVDTNAVLTLGSLSGASGGSVELNEDGDVVFTPGADECGEDGFGFNYLVSDGELTDTGGVTITLICVNDAPAAADDTEDGTEDTPVVMTPGSLLGNDSDVDADAILTLGSLSGASGGSVELSEDGDVVFTPSADECGADGFGFDYLVSDGELTDTGRVTITLTCVNDAPGFAAGPNAPGSGQYSDTISVGLSAGDVDNANSALAFTVGGASACEGTTVPLPAGLTMTDNGDGTATVAGALGASAGSYAVCAMVTDPDGATDSTTVIFTITREAASVAFDTTNPPALRVTTAGGALNALTLKVSAKETVADQTTGSATGTAAGDINNAGLTMALSPVGGGSNLPLTCAAPSAAAGYSTKAFTCSRASVPVGTYEVLSNVTGNYYVGSGTDAFTVYDPTLGFATGGGKFLFQGDRVNFGFVAKYGRNGSSLKGNLVAVRHHANGTTSRFKANLANGAMALQTGPNCGTATFSASGTYTTWDGISALSAPIYVTSGSNPFKVASFDRNEPGTGIDSIWIGGPGMFNMSPSTSVGTCAAPGSGQARLTGGNIAVPHSAR